MHKPVCFPDSVVRQLPFSGLVTAAHRPLVTWAPSGLQGGRDEPPSPYLAGSQLMQPRLSVRPLDALFLLVTHHALASPFRGRPETRAVGPILTRPRTPGCRVFPFVCVAGAGGGSPCRSAQRTDAASPTGASPPLRLQLLPPHAALSRVPASLTPALL